MSATLAVSIIGLVTTVATTAASAATGILVSKKANAEAKLDNLRILYEIYRKNG